MTIAFGSIGAKSAGGTSTVAVGHPANIAAGNMLVNCRAIWNGTAAAVNEGGWIPGGERNGGTGTAADAHTTRIRNDVKIASGIENNLPNSTTFDQSGTISGAMGVMARYTKASNKVWDTVGGMSIPSAHGDDATHGADRSVTTGTLNLKAGDMLVIGMPVDTDAALTITNTTISATGFTFGTINRRTSGAGVVTGTDGNIELFDVEVLTGTEASVAVTFTVTTATTQCGPVAITRLREVDPFYPSLIDGVEPETHGRMNIIQDGNGNLYRITESYLSNPTDYQNQPQAMKSTDGGLTWVEQDAVNRPGRSGSNIVDLESFALVKDGTGIAMINQGSDRISYMRFRTSDHATNPDTWEITVREDSATTQAPSPAPQYVSITNPSDQAYDWLIWQATGGRYRSRTNSTTFGTITNIDGTAALFPTAVLASDNVTWILYKKTGTPNQLHYKKLTSGGTLDGTSTRVDTNGVSAHADHVVPYAAPVAYDVGADKVVSIIFTNASEQLRCVDIVNGTPGSEQTVTTDTIAGDEGTTTSLQSLLALAVDGTTLYALWVNLPDWDIKYSKREYGGSWSAPVNLYTTGTTEIAYVTAAIVEHSGAKYLGYTYDLGPHGDDDANVLYNRLSIGAPPLSGGAWGIPI